MLLAQDFLPFPGETQFLGYIRASYREMFPHLVDQSQFNRRARHLRLLVEELRRNWLNSLGMLRETAFLLDTKPVPILGYKRRTSHSEFGQSVDFGYCGARRLHYFGYRFVALTTCDGLPIGYELVPANTDEREVAEEVLEAGAYVHLWRQGFHRR